MAQPNLVSPTTIKAVAIRMASTTTPTSIFGTAPGAGHLFLVLWLRATNITTTTAGTVSLSHVRSATGRSAATAISCGPGGGLDLLSKQSIASCDGDAGDDLQISSSANSVHEVVGMYLDIS